VIEEIEAIVEIVDAENPAESEYLAGKT